MTPPRRRRRLVIGLAALAAAALLAVTDGWVVHRFGANAAAARYPDDYLTSVACPSPAECWAVGQTASAPGGNTLSEAHRPLLERETDGHWVTVAAARMVTAALEAVACPGASDCWAVGGDSARGQAIIEHWAGGAWRPAASPVLPGGQLDGVSCASPGACWATGGVLSRSGAAAGVLEHWNGSAWSIAAAVGGLRPETLSCPVAGHCLALGTARGGQAAAAAYSVGVWTPVPAPPGPAIPPAPMSLAGGSAAALALLGCASPGMCLAAFPGGDGVTDVWNGSAWTAEHTALPAYPVALDCADSRGCWLLGMTRGYRPLALRWQGRGWAPLRVADPDRGGYLTALACGGRCWAVGGTGGARRDGVPYTNPLIEPVTSGSRRAAGGSGGSRTGRA